MTEWNAAEYVRISELQAAMAEQMMALLDLKGSEQVLDVGCGDGRITTKIAARVPQGSVVGVDASQEMISFATGRSEAAKISNLRFDVADARHLPFKNEFDLVVSFNALHWVPEQELALRGIRSAMKSSGRAQLRLVPRGQRKSLENVLEETRLSSRWAKYFDGFHDPYLHLTQEEYGELAEQNGLRVIDIHTEDQAWDFKSRPAFFAFGSVTFVAWTTRLPESEKPPFIEDVLDRYRAVAMDHPGEENAFKFYQMDVTLEAS
jgi:trans-aconitate 2-methyltransferase